MTRVVYVNGQFVSYAQAGVHAEDRGFQFGDAVYEVCEVKEGRLIDETRHLARLMRSLGELEMRAPMPPTSLSRVIRETIRRNRVRNGLVYLQVSRGAGSPTPSKTRGPPSRWPSSELGSGGPWVRRPGSGGSTGRSRPGRPTPSPL